MTPFDLPGRFFPGMPHAHIMRTLELLAREVMPAFQLGRHYEANFGSDQKRGVAARNYLIYWRLPADFVVWGVKGHPRRPIYRVDRS